MKSFLAELRRRNVLRVAVLYAIVGWLVIQIADIVIPALGIPAWTLSFIIVLVVLGAPIALVLAWAYELTPEGIRRTPGVEDPAPRPVTQRPQARFRDHRRARRRARVCGHRQLRTARPSAW